MAPDAGKQPKTDAAEQATHNGTAHRSANRSGEATSNGAAGRDSLNAESEKSSARKPETKQRSRASRRQATVTPANVPIPVISNNPNAPIVPLPGPMSAMYGDFLREWEHSRTLPQHLVYAPDFELASLTLDALSNSDEVYNRELSWLDFNWRVLHEAIDTRTPLLERLKFIAITSSNLDEYL